MAADVAREDLLAAVDGDGGALGAKEAQAPLMACMVRVRDRDDWWQKIVRDSNGTSILSLSPLSSCEQGFL